MNLSPALMERVDKGFEFMDENAPGWRNTIDRTVLNMGDGNFCILGQWYRSTYKHETGFLSGYSAANAELNGGIYDPIWAHAHGFTEFGFAFWNELTDAWRQKFQEMEQKS